MYDLLQGLLYSMALRSILYTAAIIIVLFHDCQADAYVPKSQVTWWGYLKSWLKHAAVVHFFLSLLSDTFHSVGRLARWLFPRKPPDLEARRRRRLAEALQMHRSRAPRSNTCSRLLAAATIAVRFSASGVRGSQIDVAPSPLSVVLQSLEPAPPFNPASEYLQAMSLVLDSTELDDPSPICMWDSDTRVCGMDNRASGCIDDDKRNFVPGTLRPCNRKVKTFAGVFSGKIWVGTLRWNVMDHKGKLHTFLIPNSYLIPEGGMKLFSPQHWAKTRIAQGLEKGRPPQTITTSDQVIMEWNNRKDRLVLDLDKRTNVANLPLSPGYDQFKLFLQEASVDDDDPPTLVSVVSDDEEDSHPDEDDYNDGWEAAEDGETEEPHEIDFTILPQDGMTSETVETDEEHKVENLAAELLRVHHQFNHIGFAKLQTMAKSGILPRRLADCAIPACTACLYGKATRRQWRDKPKSKSKQKSIPIKRPGQCVSVDMLKSPVPGLVAQMAGWITGKRYFYALVFVDHYSRLGYVHLQKTQTAQETLQGKTLFERKCAALGIHVEHYHADNGIFASLSWREACETSRQGYSYSGVNAHFQSGVAERRIRELQELARTMLIHANARWPEAISVHLWPYALRLANDAYNESPTSNLKRSPVELFTNTAVMPEPKHWKPFGCPVYVLDNALQNAGGIKGKWEHRSRVGVYLGRSPFHARSVALVLNLQTGRVSPQFHVKFDPGFQTMKQSFDGQSPPSLWQAVCGFQASRTGGLQEVRRPEAERNRDPVFALEPTSEQTEAVVDELPREPVQVSEGAQPQAPAPQAQSQQTNSPL